MGLIAAKKAIKNEVNTLVFLFYAERACVDEHIKLLSGHRSFSHPSKQNHRENDTGYLHDGRHNR